MYLAERWPNIFIIALELILEDESTWPPNRTEALFHEWFDVTYAADVSDFATNPIESEYDEFAGMDEVYDLVGRPSEWGALAKGIDPAELPRENGPETVILFRRLARAHPQRNGQPLETLMDWIADKLNDRLPVHMQVGSDDPRILDPLSRSGQALDNYAVTCAGMGLMLATGAM